MSPSTRSRPKATGFRVDGASAQPVPKGHKHAGLQSLVVPPALCADGHGAHHDPATLEDAVRLRMI